MFTVILTVLTESRLVLSQQTMGYSWWYSQHLLAQYVHVLHLNVFMLPNKTDTTTVSEGTAYSNSHSQKAVRTTTKAQSCV